jgi:glycerol kinase
LRDNLGLIKESSEIGDLAAKVAGMLATFTHCHSAMLDWADNSPDNGGVVFVTAFSGLFAPYWIDDAQGTICKCSVFGFHA